MMNAKEIARGGLLAAAAVALLYIGGAAPYFGPAACIVAGVTSAVPLLRRARLRMALLMYAAASILGLLIVPRKSVAAAYVLLTGLYPIVKFGVECYLPREWCLKQVLHSALFRSCRILCCCQINLE